MLGSSKKMNPVWKGIWVVNKIMSAVLLGIKNTKKVCVVHHDTIMKCGDSDLPRWVERLRGQIKEREPKKVRERIKMLEVGKERLSSVVLLGKRSQGGHSQEDGEVYPMQNQLHIL